MGRVTQRVDAASLAGLASQPPRAALAFERGGRASVVPVVLQRDGDAFRVGIARDALPESGLPSEGVLLVDDGRYWFELRGIVWRGALSPDTLPPRSSEHAWLRFEPRHEAAWDYGQLREVPGP
jgi:hypothetical protein